MATDQQLIQSLVAAAEKILKRSLTPAERDRLVKIFNETAGNTFNRALETIQNFSSLDESELMKKSAASDDTARTMDDLREIATNWKPGS